MDAPIITAATPRTATYTATAGQTAFPIPFGYFAQAEVRCAVYRDDVLIASYAGGDGSMSCAPTANASVVAGVAGTATIPARTVGDVVILYAVTSAERDFDFSTAGVRGGAVDREINRRVAVEVELREALGRAPVLPAGETGGALDKPADNYVLGWFGGAWRWMTSLGATAVSSFMQSALVASSAHALAKIALTSHTVTDLAALALLSAPSADLTYRTKAADDDTGIGGGEFDWDASSTEDDDGGTVIALSAGGTGRFIRRIRNGKITPADFGCVCDGVADDALKLRKACAAANRLGIFLDGELRPNLITLPIPEFAIRHERMIVRGPAVSATTSIGETPYYTEKILCTIDCGDMWGASWSKTTLAGVATRGDETLTVTSSAGFLAGDRVLIHEAANWGAGGVAKLSETGIVKSVASGQVVLEGGIEGTYSASATLRKFPEVDPISLFSHFEGGGSGLAQIGLVIANPRSVIIQGATADKCQKIGVLVANAYSIAGDFLKASRADLTGFGYGFCFTGSSNLQIGQLWVENCRHGVCSGAGLSGGQLARNHQFGSISGIGMTDATYNSHPGVVDCQIGNYRHRGQNDSSTSGDGFISNGTRLQVGRADIQYFRRIGFLHQPYGDGDGVKGWSKVGHLAVRSVNTNSSYVYAFDDANAAGAVNTGLLEIGAIDGEGRVGVLVKASQNDIEKAVIGPGRIVVSTNTHGIQFQNTANGRIKEALAIGVTCDVPASAGIYPFYFQGVSGQTTRGRLMGCTAIGGDFSIRANHATVDRSHFDSQGAVQGEYVADTGGVFNLLHGSKTWDPGSIADGDEEVTELTVTGAALGDIVDGVSFSLDVADLQLSAQVTAANTVTIQLLNNTGGPIDLSAGTVKASVRKSF